MRWQGWSADLLGNSHLWLILPKNSQLLGVHLAVTPLWAYVGSRKWGPVFMCSSFSFLISVFLILFYLVGETLPTVCLQAGVIEYGVSTFLCGRHLKSLSPNLMWFEANLDSLVSWFNKESMEWARKCLTGNSGFRFRIKNFSFNSYPVVPYEI